MEVESDFFYLASVRSAREEIALDLKKKDKQPTKCLPRIIRLEAFAFLCFFFFFCCFLLVFIFSPQYSMEMASDDFVRSRLTKSQELLSSLNVLTEFFLLFAHSRSPLSFRISLRFFSLSGQQTAKISAAEYLCVLFYVYRMRFIALR